MFCNRLAATGAVEIAAILLLVLVTSQLPLQDPDVTATDDLLAIQALRTEIRVGARAGVAPWAVSAWR